MSGRRVNPKTNADGEIDENFWAQAAAEKTAERSGEGANEGESLKSRFFELRNLPLSHSQMVMTSQYRSTLSSSTTTTMMVTGSDLTMGMTAEGTVPPRSAWTARNLTS